MGNANRCPTFTISTIPAGRVEYRAEILLQVINNTITQREKCVILCDIQAAAGAVQN
jgi:hypothetical protein